MNNILISGGWFIWPLLVCSILLISIVIERLWFLQRRLVAPKGLQRQVQNLINKNAFHAENQEEIAATSQLGELLTYCYQYITLSLIIYNILPAVIRVCPDKSCFCSIAEKPFLAKHSATSCF